MRSTLFICLWGGCLGIGIFFTASKKSYFIEQKSEKVRLSFSAQKLQRIAAGEIDLAYTAKDILIQSDHEICHHVEGILNDCSYRCDRMTIGKAGNIFLNGNVVVERPTTQQFVYAQSAIIDVKKKKLELCQNPILVELEEPSRNLKANKITIDYSKDEPVIDLDGPVCLLVDNVDLSQYAPIRGK